LKGRYFTERDNLDSPPVVIIDEALARKAFPNQEPLAKRLTAAGDQPREIVGVVIGVAATIIFGRLMASLLFGVVASDTVIFAIASLLLVAVAVVASYLPARRAMRIDPIVALGNKS
jgi:hypothetical protein